MGAPSMRPTRTSVIHRRPTAGLDFGFKHVYLLPCIQTRASGRKRLPHCPGTRLSRNVRRELSDHEYNTTHRYEHPMRTYCGVKSKR